MYSFSLTLFALTSLAILVQISGHGYMSDPPGRASAWRFGFDTTPNFNDNEVTCGRVEFSKCGVCGDPLSEIPGDNTLGGKYGSGTITKTYTMGQVVKTKTKITANHAGWFEFSLCEIRNNQPATESCFQTLISTSVPRRPKDVESPETKWELFMADGLGDFDVDVQLPAGFTCNHCVMRWLWNCGNDFACNKDGKCGVGLGPKQEKFYSCADIAITSDGAPKPTKKPTTPTPTRLTTQQTTTTWSQQTTDTWPRPTTTRPKKTTTATNPTTTSTSSKTQGFTTTKFRTTTARVTTRHNGFTTTPPNRSTVCQGKKHGSIEADPKNCCRFVNCLWSGTTFETEKWMTCALGTAWNAKGKYCDYKANVDCGNRENSCTF